MIDVISPAFYFLIASVIVAFLPHGIVRSALLLGTPIVAGLQILELPTGVGGTIELAGLTLETVRVDKLSIIFGLIFCFAAFIGNLYALHVKDRLQQVAALAYAGSAVGAVFAGDLVTLFLFWEGTALTSVFLIWARQTEGAYHTGMRYLIIQIASGVILLGGVVMLYRETGSLAFEAMTLGSLATWLIFIAFGIKCAFPLLHNWVQDAYPASTITGMVILSSFTTKLAVYALARGFPGTELLIYIGAVMAVFPNFYAVIENDLRRVLAYSLNIQLGFMVVGVGVGTELALNGVAAHAVVHILYKALLLMAIGAVMFRTGKSKATELGGIGKSMPMTMMLCIIGAMAASAFPLFSGYASKSLITSGTSQAGHAGVWLALLFASAAALYHTGIKVPYAAFFAKDSGMRPKEAPTHMLLAMSMTAFLCIAIGVYPDPLYALLPNTVDYTPYTMTHVIKQLQLLMFSALVFVVLMRIGLYPSEIKSVNLDTDVVYRRLLPRMITRLRNIISSLFMFGTWFAKGKAKKLVRALHNSHGPEGRMARVWPNGAMVMWIAIILTATLLVNFVR